MKKLIYTAIIGGYDNLKEPSIITPGWDYICFTDNKNPPSSLFRKKWNIIYTPSQEDLAKFARKLKIRYFDFTSDGYDMSIWIDGSIQVRCDLNEFVSKYFINTEYAVLKHNIRSDILSEAEACAKLKKGDSNLIRTQMKEYYKNGYTFENGLAATGLMIRKHNSAVRAFCTDWYKEIEKHTHRDQLSFNYVLSKHYINLKLIPYKLIHSETDFKLHIHNRR